MFGRRWRDYLLLLSALAVVLVAAALAPAFAYKQLCIGLVVGFIVAAATFGAARFDAPIIRDYLAETFSPESLREVSGWLVLGNLPFEGSTSITSS